MNAQKDEQPATGIKEDPEDLFEWDESPDAPLNYRDNTSLTSPLRTLKTIIWSIDWEITDQMLMMLNQELRGLMQFYHDDDTVIRFLQLLEALGRYITKRKGRAHPESVNLLRAFFIELERIVFLLGLSESERKAVLKKQMDKFNALKKKLAASRAAAATSPATSPKDETSSSKTVLKPKDPPEEPLPGAKRPSKQTTPKADEPPPRTVPMAGAPPQKATAKKKLPGAKALPEEKTPPVEPAEEVMSEFSPEVFRQMMLDEMRLVIRYEFKKIKAELEEMIENKSPAKQG